MAGSPIEISPTSPEVTELDYPFLKQQGIAYLQELAGKVWTDYNEHDPGITILEELCYAIVDLEYRTNFFIEDLLAPDPNEAAEDDVKHFYNAEEILPCNPLTSNDFIKLVADVPGVRNVKIRLSQGPQEIKGGYRIFLDLEERVIQRGQEQEVIEAVQERLHENRNLCEDFFEVSLLTPLYVSVNLTLEVHQDTTPDEGAALLAEALSNIQSFVAPYVRFYSLRNMLIDKKRTVERIYTGPLLQQGFIDERELQQNHTRSTVYASEILEQVTQLRQVANVAKFSIQMGEEEATSTTMAITIPHDSVLKVDVRQSNLAIFQNGTPITISTDKVQQYFDEMVNARLYERPYLLEEEIATPEGRFRNLSAYYSVQHNFPLVYGVGNEGLPKSAPKERKAQAHQLKGYLMFFDQLFANYLAQLSHVRDLMAVDTKEHKTYYTQIPHDVPNWTRLTKVANLDGEKAFSVQRNYLGIRLSKLENKHPNRAAFLQEAYQYYLRGITESKEHHRVKKSKTLDHLLARFAEVFTSYSLLAYSTFREQALKTAMYDKGLFLRDYIAISRDRNKAFDLTEAAFNAWDSENISGFERRICRLLGIRKLQRRFLHEALKGNFYVEQEYEHQSLEVFLGENLQSKYDNLFIFKGNFPQIRQLAIRYGSEEANYDIVEKANGGYDIVLNIDKSANKAIQLVNRQVEIKSVEQARAIIRQAVRFFRDFNQASEGLHLVEHILLRDDTALKGLDDPYSFMMTVVFPSWPIRFQKPSFRNLAQELIMAESPAHVLVNVLWLDLEEMELFEKAYKAWIGLKTTRPMGDPQLNKAAKNLLGLIMLYVGSEEL